MQTHAAQMATPSMALDKQLRDIKLHGVLQRRQLGQALNAKEFAVLAGLSYSTARAWFRLPGFPVIKGVIFWGDFIEWRRARTGLADRKEAGVAEAKPEDRDPVSKAHPQFPPRAARILSEAS